MTEPEKITVLQIVEDLKIGGLERVIQALALGLPRAKYRVKVWCLTNGGAIADELRLAGIEVETLRMGPRCSLVFLLRLGRKMREEGIDILHAHGYTACTIGRIAGFVAKVPVIIAHVHSVYTDYTAGQLVTERILSVITDKILCCSRAAADFVVNREKVRSGKVALVYNGAADMRVAGGGKNSFGFSEADLVVGLAASFVENKGHAYLLEALAAAAKVRPGLKAIFAGDGPLKRGMEELAEEKDLASAVVFCGLIPDMPRFFAAADIVVLPSVEREGLGVALLEAMSAGKAVIGTRIGGIPEAVEDGKTGLLVPPRDAAALAGAILALAGNRGLREEMGRAGRAVYEEKFTPQKMISGVAGIYEELLR